MFFLCLSFAQKQKLEVKFDRMFEPLDVCLKRHGSLFVRMHGSLNSLQMRTYNGAWISTMICTLWSEQKVEQNIRT